MDLFDNEPRDTFRRNFLLVVTAHAGLLGTVWLFNRGAATPPPEQITWLDGSAFAAPAPAPAPTRELVAPAEPPPSPKPEAEPEPEVEPDPIRPPPADPEPIAERKPTPAPTPPPTSAPKPTPRPQAKRATPTPKPKVTKTTPAPKSRPVSTATAKPKAESPRASATATTASGDSDAKRKNSPSAANASATGSGERLGAPNGSATATEIQTYYAAVGETFRGTWNVYKPLVGEGSGARLSARVHVRISASGSVLESTLTQSTGNREVDDSIRRSFADFKNVPAPPTALLKGGVFESDIAVILTI